MRKYLKTLMTIEIEVEVSGDLVPGYRGDSGCSPGVIGLTHNPSPPENPYIEDIGIFLTRLIKKDGNYLLDKIDITDYMPEDIMDQAEDILWEKNT